MRHDSTSVGPVTGFHRGGFGRDDMFFEATQVSGSSRGIGWLGDSGVSEMCVFFFCIFSVSTWVKLWGFVSKKKHG